MDLGRPYKDVLPGPRGRLLTTLVQLEARVTVRALARFAGISPQAALDYVNELSDAGIVVAERAGAAMLVSLNRMHLAAEPLVALARLRARLVEHLQAELADWPTLAGAWLFGSAARGDGDRESDVDVLLVADTTTETAEWADAVGRLRERIRAWTGNESHLVEHTRSSFRSLVEAENPLIAKVRKDGIELRPESKSLFRGAA